MEQGNIVDKLFGALCAVIFLAGVLWAALEAALLTAHGVAIEALTLLAGAL